MTRSANRFGFTLIELLVVISIIALLIGILLPALGAARRTARQMQSNTQIRGIHQSLVIYAQSNNTRFPGLSGSGAVLADTADTTGNSGLGSDVQSRYWILLDGNYFTGEYAISPVESGDKAEWTTGSVSTDNYSFAMLTVLINATAGAVPSSPRSQEWGETLNTEAVVISDRNTRAGSGNAGDPWSIHTGDNEDWRGSVGFNDNHVVFSPTSVMDRTRYGNAEVIEDDRLFASDPSFTTVEPDIKDARMAYDGERSYE